MTDDELAAMIDSLNRRDASGVTVNEAEAGGGIVGALAALAASLLELGAVVLRALASMLRAMTASASPAL